MKHKRFTIIIIGLVLATAASLFIVLGRLPDVSAAVAVDQRPAINPAFHDVTIPPNIAPINFYVGEPGRRYCVKWRAKSGHSVTVVSRNALINTPQRKWRRLLASARADDLLLDVYVESDDRIWRRYRSLVLHVATDTIDPFIAYRMLRPNFTFWRSVGVYQRDLESWDESDILHGRSFDDGCVNCHTFRNNSPDQMFLGIRGAQASATLLAQGGSVDKINAKWGYTAWHPAGHIAIYTVMKVRQFLHHVGAEIRDVVDLDASLLYYHTRSRSVKTARGLADNQRLETYPTWSPDGRHLYFCSAPIPWQDRDTVPPVNFDKVRYDLRRISYDRETDTWGAPETVLSAENTGMSILLPRISPDGNSLLFCMCDYGCFPIFRSSSDLYMLNLTSGAYTKLSVNTAQSESWHSWSTNGRWIIFSSRRQGGHFTRLFISHVSADGKVGRPFILPQKDPAYYDSLLETYNVPEFITGPVTVSRRALVNAARRPPTIDVHNPLVTGATPKGIVKDASEPYRSSR